MQDEEDLKQMKVIRMKEGQLRQEKQLMRSNKKMKREEAMKMYSFIIDIQMLG